jgi:hypothetical protein
MSIESKRGGREKKRRIKTRFYNFGKAYFSPCSSIITPLPLLFKDELKCSS